MGEETAATETFETRLIAIGLIDIPENHRKPNKENVKKIAESVELHGLLQAIGVRANDGRFILVFGGNRLAAHKQLGRDVIEAKVLDIDESDAEAVMHAENLFRLDLSQKERFDALAQWVEYYKAKHPEAGLGRGRAALMTNRTRKAAKEAARVDSTPASPEPLAPTPAQALSALTGKCDSVAKTDVRIAEKLTSDQRSALIDREVGKDAMVKVAAIKSEENKQKAVTLIASGMDVPTAIAVALAPANATLETVVVPHAEGHKAEADMTDDEWFDFFCGDTAARLAYRASYKADAILWRHTRDSRAEHRSKTRRHLAQSRIGIKGPFHFRASNYLNIAHPKDWPMCGPCGGTGSAGNVSKCPKCNGHAFALKTEIP